jgi:hypothetical protein
MAYATVLSENSAATERASGEISNRYSEYKRARAAWDVVLATDDDERSSGDEQQRLCSASCDALNRLLLTPAENVHDLNIKLRVFNDEEIDDNWTMSRPIVALLADDARRIARAA